MKIIDTHAHINSEEFENNVEEVINRAKQVGVSKIVIPNVDANSIESMLALAQKYPDFVYPMIGLHPTEINENYRNDLQKMYGLLQNHTFIAIGEIGFDLYWDNTKFEIQKEVFKIQYQWAQEFNLPMNIHIRNAFDELFATLDEIGAKSYNGIIHCFSGNEQQAQRCMDYGFMFGAGGIVTFKKSEVGNVLKKNVPLQRIVLETDAPWLAPVPYRGRQNEPSYIVSTAQKLADIYEVSIDELTEITTKNAEKIYGI